MQLYGVLPTTGAPLLQGLRIHVIIFLHREPGQQAL